jgi:hypothetical protein
MHKVDSTSIAAIGYRLSAAAIRAFCWSTVPGHSVEPEIQLYRTGCIVIPSRPNFGANEE